MLQQLGIQGSVTELSAFARVVDGHPLILRLAAGYLREYCGSQLSRVQEMGKQFEQIAAEAEGLHRDKQDACLSWILQQHFQRLTTTQRDFLFNLSVHRQPFDYQAAARMLPADGEVTPMTIQQSLRELFNRSLLLEAEDKYLYQPLIRQYVQQQGMDLRVAHQKAINYYLLNLKQRPWQTIDDVTEYLETFYHHCELKQYAQAFNTIRYSSSNDDCDNFLSLSGYSAIRVQLYSQVVQAWQPSENEIWKFSASLNSLGSAYYFLGEYHQAIDYYQQSLEIVQEIGDRSGIAYSLNNLGSAYDALGEYQQAIDYHQQSLVIAREIGDRRGEADTWFNLAIVLNKLNQQQDAMGAYRNSRQLYQAMQLDADVQDCDNEIQQIEASLAAVSQPVVRRFPVGVLGFVWRWLQRLWALVRGRFRRR